MTEERDPRVSWRYRELGAEEPPRELDQAILAAAHRAADRAHAPLVAPAGRHRWYFAFGAAAILVLAVAITVQVDKQADPEALSASTASVASDRVDNFRMQAEKESKREAEPSKPLAEAAPPPAEAKPQAAEAARADRLESKPAQPATTEAQPIPAPRSAPQADSRDSSAALRSAVEPAPSARQFGAGAMAGPAGAAASPEALLEGIAELRKQGRHEEADKALADFRKLYPDYRISEEMLKKVERGK